MVPWLQRGHKPIPSNHAWRQTPAPRCQTHDSIRHFPAEGHNVSAQHNRSRSPKDHADIREAAKLKEQHDVLQAELLAQR
eukprot:CAMPEP_0172831914 /NCGR_PEP_ID=MMETSP1075-20121228/23304_1 /TAXON_ID=2916 /ORGANISM="Ceratium fusus, Strain PA161109" /LENGTH=79 /DNA_ID=CAMNT_0013674447 /DNA_START=29 /DNA_END=265 /DNA_ORIENTATION=+